MPKETAIVILNIHSRKFTADLEIPLDITPYDLFVALNCAYNLNVDTTDVTKCYLKAENPIALLKGNKTLGEFGLRNGSIIHFTD